MTHAITQTFTSYLYYDIHCIYSNTHMNNISTQIIPIIKIIFINICLSSRSYEFTSYYFVDFDDKFVDRV